MGDDEINGDIKLRTGREVYANCGILGIGPTLEIGQGYDGMLTYMPAEYQDEPDLTPAEVAELCDIAIDRWQRLKALVTRPKV